MLHGSHAECPNGELALKLAATSQAPTRPCGVQAFSSPTTTIASTILLTGTPARSLSWSSSGDYTDPIEPLANSGSFTSTTSTSRRSAAAGCSHQVTRSRWLTQNGATLASPVTINDYAFKAVCAS